eukprot:jgi/Botrbrau1/5353/Bobra.0346s0024.1
MLRTCTQPAQKRLFMHREQLGRHGQVGGQMVTLEQQYRAWSKKRRRFYDLMSMVGTLGLSFAVPYSVTSAESVLVMAVQIMGALSAASILTILFKEDVFYVLRDFIMAAMSFLITIAGLSYAPLLNLAVSSTDQWRAFISICCNRFIGVMMSSMAFRLPVSWAACVAFPATFISACGGVRAARLFAENDPGNQYVKSVCTALNIGLARCCRAIVAGVDPLIDGAGDFLPCGEVTITPRHTVLFIWLVGHMLGFWAGFFLSLREEVAERKAFLQENRGEALAHSKHTASVLPMVLQMLAVQVFGFAYLLSFGNDL